MYERREREKRERGKICELTVGVFHLSSSKRDVVSKSFLQGITFEHKVTKLYKVFLAPIVLKQKFNEIMNILSSS